MYRSSIKHVRRTDDSIMRGQIVRVRERALTCICLSHYNRHGMDEAHRRPSSTDPSHYGLAMCVRTYAGKCLRLVTEADYHALLPAVTPPEVQRCDLSPVVLSLKALGVCIDLIVHWHV